MKWTTKYDFIDLYKRRLGKGQFNPGGSIDLKNIEIPYENTIIIGASKIQRDFDDNPKSPTIAVLFVSNDRGKSYKEINTGDEYLEDMESKGDYTLVTAWTSDSLAVKHYKIFLLHNKTFELKKVAEYADENLSYRYFDGKYVVQDDDLHPKLINLLNKKEEYNLPIEKIGKSLFHVGDGKIIYEKEQEIREYNAITKEDKLINTLKNKYDYFFYLNNRLTLQKKIYDERDKYEYDIYDIYEKKLYTETNENRDFYRYKNFVCDYRKLGTKPEIRYSYDYGKTWKVHHVTDFTILQNIFGFYKDEFLVTEGIFWHFDSPESGGRVTVGEFVK